LHNGVMQFPWIKDPKTDKKSVSATFVLAAFILNVVLIVLHAAEKVASTSNAFELMILATTLYFGRKIHFTKGEKGEIEVSSEDK
jgi:hypothetical protein